MKYKINFMIVLLILFNYTAKAQKNAELTNMLVVDSVLKYFTVTPTQWTVDTNKNWHFNNKIIVENAVLPIFIKNKADSNVLINLLNLMKSDSTLSFGINSFFYWAFEKESKSLQLYFRPVSSVSPDIWYKYYKDEEYGNWQKYFQTYFPSFFK